MERKPSEAELEEARERARADAEQRQRDEKARPAADQPVVENAGPYEFAPEALRDEYERAYEEARRTLARRR